MAYTGSLALRLVGAEELLARSAAFRDRIPVADEAAAKHRVYVGELADVLALLNGGTLAAIRPCAIIGVERHSYVQIGQGAQIDLGANGAVWVIFLDNPNTPDNHKQSLLDFADWISRVMDQVAADSGNDTRWPFHAIELFFEPLRPDIADRTSDDYWMAGYLLLDSINWGGG